MRSGRVLATGVILLAGLVGVLLLTLLASIRPGAPDDALALSPTPQPFDIEWTITGTEAYSGGTVHVTALADPQEREFDSARASEPTYHLDIEGDALELKSPAEVSPEDVEDGAAWELNAVHEGEATLTIRLDYTLSYWMTVTPPGSYHVTTETTETIEVAGAPNGDVNLDGVTNSIDAFHILQHTAGIILPPPPNSDVNLDGVANSLDAMLILQYDAGLVTELPIVG